MMGRILFIFGLVFFVIGLVYLDLPLLIRHETTTGSITSMAEMPSTGRQDWNTAWYTFGPVYSFFDKDGHYRSDWAGYQGHELGDAVTIIYDPRNSHRSRIYSVVEFGPPAVFIGLGLFIGILGLRQDRQDRAGPRTTRRELRELAAI